MGPVVVLRQLPRSLASCRAGCNPPCPAEAKATRTRYGGFQRQGGLGAHSYELVIGIHLENQVFNMIGVNQDVSRADSVTSKLYGLHATTTASGGS